MTHYNVKVLHNITHDLIATGTQGSGRHVSAPKADDVVISKGRIASSHAPQTRQDR
jgi:hypothetical protein